MSYADYPNKRDSSLTVMVSQSLRTSVWAVDGHRSSSVAMATSSRKLGSTLAMPWMTLTTLIMSLTSRASCSSLLSWSVHLDSNIALNAHPCVCFTQRSWTSNKYLMSNSTFSKKVLSQVMMCVACVVGFPMCPTHTAEATRVTSRHTGTTWQGDSEQSAAGWCSVAVPEEDNRRARPLTQRTGV